MTNPVTVLAFVGVFTGLEIGVSRAYADAAVLVCGVFFGSALWWLVLSSAVGRFRGWFTRPVMRRVNRVAGAVLVGFGLFALGGAL